MIWVVSVVGELRVKCGVWIEVWSGVVEGRKGKIWVLLLLLKDVLKWVGVVIVEGLLLLKLLKLLLHLLLNLLL